jgi:hypothetical protein
MRDHLTELLLSWQAARNNVLLAVPALLYAINNYLKFIMQVCSCIEKTYFFGHD